MKEWEGIFRQLWPVLRMYRPRAAIHKCCRSSCWIKTWPSISAPAITCLMPPFFARLVPRTFPLHLLLVCEEQPDALWSHCCSVPIHWADLGHMAVIFTQENMFLQFFWQDWALPQGSKPSLFSTPLLLQLFDATSLPGCLWRGWGWAITPESFAPELLKIVWPHCKTLHPSQEHPQGPPVCFVSQGSPTHSKWSPLCWCSAKATYTLQVPSLPLGDRDCRWLVWLSVFKI